MKIAAARTRLAHLLAGFMSAILGRAEPADPMAAAFGDLAQELAPPARQARAPELPGYEAGDTAARRVA